MSVEILVDAVVYALATYLDKWGSFRIRGSILAQAYVGDAERNISQRRADRVRSITWTLLYCYFDRTRIHCNFMHSGIAT